MRFLQSICVRPQNCIWEVIQTEDQTIIKLSWERSEDAIALLDRKYGRLLRHITNGILENRQDSEEVINDTYMKLWDSIPPEQPRYLSAYSIRIARNTALMLLEYNRRDKRDMRQNVVLSEVEECLPSQSTPEQELEEAETLLLINRWLESICKKDRTLFMRRYFSLDSLENIASDFGMTPNAVSIRLCRARAELKQVLEKEDVTI